MALSTKTLDALNDSRKTEPHKYIWGQFTPDKEGVGYSDLPEQTNIPDDAKLVLDVNGPSLVTASVKDLKNGISVDIATTEKAGIVKPDGTTISVSPDGTIGTTLDTSNFITNSALSNCILSAPNGVLTASGDRELTAHQGLTVSLTDGYGVDGSIKSEVYTLPGDITTLFRPSPSISGIIYVFLVKDTNNGVDILTVNIHNLSFSNTFPANILPEQSYVAYETSTNYLKYQVYDGQTSTIKTLKCALLGKCIVNSGNISSLVSYKPIQLSLEGLGDYVVESQVLRDGSWYRKYKSGWVEQGGYFKHPDSGGTGTATITLPVEMANSNYQVIRTTDKGGIDNASDSKWVVGINGNTRTTTSFSFFYEQISHAIGDFWEVKGMSK